MGKPERGNNRLTGIFLIAVLAAGLFLALFDPALLRAPENRDFLGGGWTTGYKEAFERGLPIRKAAVQTIGALRYLLFREGEEGVLVGEGGWLFTSEEFACPPDGPQVMAENLGFVREVRDLLARRGIDLIVVLLPSKARIYADKLGRYRLPPCAAVRYEEFRHAVLELGIDCPDLLTALREARSREEVFFRTDTHWRPYGAAAAAAAAAEAGRPRLDRKSSPRSRYVTRRLGVRDFQGDLLRFVPLGRFQRILGIPSERVEVLETEAREESPLGLFDRPVIPVALVGTSYSAGRTWNFDGALKEALEADVLNLGAEGRGPFLPMRTYLSGQTFDQVPPDLVLWEIPERCLQEP